MRDDRRATRLRVGRTIRQLRRLRGLTQERLAELVGNTHKHIGAVESGKTNVTIDILTAIAAGLSVKPADLFGPASHVSPLTERELEQIEQALLVVRRAMKAVRQRD